MILILTIISFLYGITGIISILGYIPTIKDLLHKKASANINSYIIWTLTSGVTFLYALFVISDLLLEIMTGLNFVSCAVIWVLALILTHKK